MIYNMIYNDCNGVCMSVSDMSKVQDDEVGDGTTSVTVLAAELLRVSAMCYFVYLLVQYVRILISEIYVCIYVSSLVNVYKLLALSQLTSENLVMQHPF